MITLPPIHQVSLGTLPSLKSFSVVIGFLGTSIVVIVWHLSEAAQLLLIGAILFFLLFALLGLLWPRIVIWPYRIWNRLAAELARHASTLLMGILFYVIFVGVGRFGSSMRLLPPRTEESLWVHRGMLQAAAYESQFRVPLTETDKLGWISPIVSWMIRSRDILLLCLLPFLILLWALELEQENNVPADIYTLF